MQPGKSHGAQPGPDGGFADKPEAGSSTFRSSSTPLHSLGLPASTRPMPNKHIHLEDSYQDFCNHGTSWSLRSVHRSWADRFVQFKDRFSFRRKGSRDTEAEASDHPLPPLYRTTDQAILRSSQEPSNIHRSLTATSGIPSVPRERSKSPTGVRDPLGLRVLHSPEGGRRVDIVFVHGLGGTSRLTWSKNKDLDLFWPLTFLPLEPDICQGRIMTFGYNGSFLKSSSKNSATVLDFAKDLLYDLKYAKDASKEDLGIGSVPVIFLVHSMGGLIVKEAYMQGQYDPEYKAIIDAISAIIFLSTPHRGTNLAETLNRILQASIISSSKQFISELTKNSFTLQKLNEQFRHVAPKLDIVSFYETQMTSIGINRNKIMVLERDSSVLGYPGEISKALDADHHGVCKYDSPDDPLYINVRNVLKSLVSKFPVPGSGSAPIPTKREDLRDIETFLAMSEPPDVDYIFFRDRWVPDTCGWVLEDDSFYEWMHDPAARPRVLWLHGAAASGKSVLSSFIINHLAQLGLSCQYFFVRFGDQSKRSLSTLLRCIALQVAQSLPIFRQGILRLVGEATKVDTADAQTIWNRIFKTILFKIRLDSPLFWVVDGLEESDDPRSFIKLISEINLAVIPIRILVVSRKSQGLVSSFQRLSKEVQLDIIPYEGSPNDFRYFVDRELDVIGDSTFYAHVKDQILERARGNFLWVHLAVQRVNDCHTAANVEHALRQLPSGMEALYDRMAQSVAALPQEEDKKLASSILAWAACALRLLTIEELSLVLEGEVLKPLDLQRSIGDLCGGFVVVDNGGNVAMIHQTAREYLIDGQTRPFNIDRSSAHEQLFLRCISCLTDLGLRSKINRRQAPAFLEYAATSWFYHLSDSSASSPRVFDTLKSFLKSSSVLTWIQCLAQANRLRTLVLASTQVSRFTLKQKAETASQKSYLEIWAIDLVKVVGKFGTNLVRNPESIYKLIPPFCPDESLIYQQFGKKESNALKITGQSLSSWDDSLARLSFGSGIHVTSIKAAGGRIAVMSPSGTVIIYYASTCEESRRIQHHERVLRMQYNLSGTLLVTYGYLTTKVWELATGRCVASVQNPIDRPRPHTILFTNDDDKVLVGADDHRIRSFSLKGTATAWQLVANIDEQALEETVVNSPTCMALSPDGHNVALGYRGHPLSVWEVEGPELVGHCLRVFDDNTQSNVAHAWGEVIQLTWHPYTGEVIGLYLEGVVFRWHPYHDETKELHTGANSIVVSQDAKCLAAGDPNGIVRLYSLADFNLVYQFASQDPVFDLCFAPDSRRLYDVRGSYGNVWEPDALLRLSELSEAPSDTEERASTVLRNAGKVDPITALASQPSGRVYCCGTESGLIELFETSRNTVLELRKSKSFMSIEHVVWSDDGKYVSFIDLSGKLFVKSVSRNRGAGGSWKIEPKLELAINVAEGAVCQVLFHPDSTRFLVYTTSTISTISLASGSILNSRKMPEAMGIHKWINHPAHEGSLLAVGPGKVLIWAWSDLMQTDHLNFSSAVTEHMGSISRSRISSSVNLWESRESIDRVLVTHEKTFILVQSSCPAGQGQNGKEILVFDVANIPHATVERPPSGNSDGPSSTTGASPRPLSSSMNSTLSSREEDELQELHSIPLDEGLTSQIEIPLAFLSRDRLVFLDQNFWLCSWRLPLSSNTTTRRPSATGNLDGSTTEIKQHYFFPSDWISPDSVALYTVMADGTVLCPRNGDVAAVKCSTLRS